MSGKSVILELNGATVLAGPGGRVILKNLQFIVRPGDLLLIRAGVDEETELLFDVCQDLVPVDSGKVLFMDRDWSRTRAGRALRMRARMGRVFQSGGWLQDLDVYENVMLRTRHHHPFASARKLYVEALAYARRVGLKDLLHVSPEELTRRDLRRFQWVRACMGEPDLLLLERPELDATPEDVARLMDLVDTCRLRGAGIVWVTSSPAVDNHEKVSSARKAVMKDGRIVMSSEES